MLQERDAIHSNVHEWDDYYRIDARRYIGDIESIRDLKRKTIAELVDIFDDWQQSINTFDQDVALEIQAVEKEYVGSYIVFASRVASGDHEALLDSPLISMVVESLMRLLPEETPLDEKFKQVARFFASEHFAQVPYHWLSVRMFAMLKDMVKRGAYANRESALGRLSGFFYDVRHIAMYAPYCDAFVMDQPMAALVADPKVGLGQRYGVRVFSLNNWDDLFAWLDTIKAEITDEHRAGLSAAYS